MKELGVLYQTPTIIPISYNYQLVCEEGMKMKVIIDCYDESYLYELFYHYRPELIEKKLATGDVVEVIGCWKNLFGSYIKCKFNNDIFDINPKKLKPL